MEMNNRDNLIIRENGIILHFAKTETNLRLLKVCTEETWTGEETVSSPDKYPYNQVHLAGSNRSGHRGVKATGAYESQVAAFAKYADSRTENGREIRITSKTDKVEITSVFRFYDGVKTVKCFQTVKNISKSDVTLEEVDSLYLYGFGGEKPTLSELYLYVPTNSWHVEAQWKKNSLQDLYLFNGNDSESMKRVSVSNTGSWSTKENLPMGILENASQGSFMLWQIESNGSWYYEIGADAGKLYLNVGGPNFEDNDWAKRLKPGETFEGVASSFSFGTTLNGVLGEVTKYRRAIRRKNDDNIRMPVIFNSYMHAFWDYPTERGLKPLIDTVATLGCEYFCIDAGWFDGDNWWATLGDYEESSVRFPSGVKSSIDYIKSKGMKAGLWLEIEDVGVYSQTARMPADWFFWRNGAIVVNHERLSLDFTQADVRARADRLIDWVVGLGVEYIKIDYNIDAGVGTDRHTETLGDGLMQHNRAYIDWLKGVFERYPALVIENCASGGCRMDYKMLSLCSVQSTSDQTDYKKYPYIAANALSAVCPEQAAVWSYPLKFHEHIGEKSADDFLRRSAMALDNETIIMNMVNSLLGRIHLAGRLDKLSEAQLSLIKEGIGYYNGMKRIKRGSVPYLPLGFTSFGADFAASGIRDDKTLYLAVWNLGGKRLRTLSLPEIEVKSVQVGYPAKEGNFSATLQSGALQLAFGADYQARLIAIELA